MMLQNFVYIIKLPLLNVLLVLNVSTVLATFCYADNYT